MRKTCLVMKKEISLIFTGTRAPCKQGFIVLYSNERIHEAFQPRPVCKCMYGQLAKVQGAIYIYIFPNMMDHIGMCSPKGYGFSFWSKNGYYTTAFYCPFWFSTKLRESLSGSKGGAVVRALASQQCGPGSNPDVDAICGLSLLLVLSLAPRGFSPGTPVFPSP